MRPQPPLGSSIQVIAVAAALTGCALSSGGTAPPTSADAANDVATTATATTVELVFQPWTDAKEQISMSISPDWAPVDVEGSAGSWFIGPPTGGAQPVLGVQSFALVDVGDDPLTFFTEVEADGSEGFALIRSGRIDGPEGQALYYVDNTEVQGDDAAPWHHRTVYAIGTSTIIRAEFISPAELWDDLAPDVVPYLNTVKNLS